MQFRCLLRRKYPNDDLPPINSLMHDYDKKNQKDKLPTRATPFMVRAYIYQCRNLPPADDNGLADPYCKIWDQKLKVSATKIVYKSLNPVFYSVKDF